MLHVNCYNKLTADIFLMFGFYTVNVIRISDDFDFSIIDGELSPSCNITERKLNFLVYSAFYSQSRMFVRNIF